jgi:MFS family permease
VPVPRSALPAAPPLAPAARRLLAARFWRSLAQGALVVDLALYLHELHWSGLAIGAVLSGGGLTGAVLSLGVGVASDRMRRKPYLLAYEVLTCACALVALESTRVWLLAPAIVLAGFGRGANGAAGPFSPAEQAWLAESVEPANRGFVYSLNGALGFLGMALGALAAILPGVWRSWLGPAGAYRPLFYLVLLGNVMNLVLLVRTPEQRGAASHPRARAESTPAGRVERRRENRFLRDLMTMNALNGLAVGLTGPLIAYWFHQRFGVGPEFIAPVMALTFVITAGASVLSGRLTRRAGLVRVVVWGRGGGLALLVLLPLMPLYSLAALLYLLRSALNRGTIGARQALVVSAVSDDRRGLAASLNAFSMQVPQAVGPTLAGALIDAGWLVTPFLLAAALQGFYVILYGRLFGPRERELFPAAGKPEGG